MFLNCELFVLGDKTEVMFPMLHHLFIKTNQWFVSAPPPQSILLTVNLAHSVLLCIAGPCI